jgi:hypothetical protein
MQICQACRRIWLEGKLNFSNINPAESIWPDPLKFEHTQKKMDVIETQAIRGETHVIWGGPVMPPVRDLKIFGHTFL